MSRVAGYVAGFVAVLLAILAAACGESPAERQANVRFDFVGPDTFWITDGAVNPGCEYWWVIRAVGDLDGRAELIGGRMLSTLDVRTAAVPSDTFYTWDRATIGPLFPSATFLVGDTRASSVYGSTGLNMPPTKVRVEFDYLAYTGGGQRTTRDDFYCLRH